MRKPSNKRIELRPIKEFLLFGISKSRTHIAEKYELESLFVAFIQYD